GGGGVARAAGAERAGAAGDYRVAGHPPAQPPRVGAFPGLYDDAGELVAHDQRRPPVGLPAQVALYLRAADAGSPGADNDPVCSRLGPSPLVHPPPVPTPPPPPPPH